MKFIPVPIATQVKAKIMPGFVVSALIMVLYMGVGGFMMVTKLGVSPIIAVSGLVLMVAAAWLMTCAGVWVESRGPRVEWGNDGDVNVKSLGGGNGEIRALLIGFVYSMVSLLVTPLVKLDPYVFMPILAIAGVAVAAFVGRMLLDATARNIEMFE